MSQAIISTHSSKRKHHTGVVLASTHNPAASLVDAFVPDTTVLDELDLHLTNEYMSYRHNNGYTKGAHSVKRSPPQPLATLVRHPAQEEVQQEAHVDSPGNQKISEQEQHSDENESEEEEEEENQSNEPDSAPGTQTAPPQQQDTQKTQTPPKAASGRVNEASPARSVTVTEENNVLLGKQEEQQEQDQDNLSTSGSPYSLGSAAARQASDFWVDGGKVVSWGHSLGVGQLGREPDSVNEAGHGVGLAPAPVPNLTEITAVSAAPFNGLAVDRAGAIWSWGGDGAGRLGILEPAETIEPRKISQKLENGADMGAVVNVSTSMGHCLAINSDGKLLSWGLNNIGELGRPTHHRDTNGDYCARTPDFVDVRTFGWDPLSLRKWHVGNKEDHPPFAFEGKTARVVQIAAGAQLVRAEFVDRWNQGLQKPVYAPNGLMGHSFALIEVDQQRTELYSWGCNHGFILGQDRETIQPREMADKVSLPQGTQVSQISTGWSHALALTADGKVFSWGSNQHGELGMRANGFIEEAEDYPRCGYPEEVDLQGKICMAVKAGYNLKMKSSTEWSAYCFSVALTREGEVLTWGGGKGSPIGFANPELVTVCSDGTPVQVQLPQPVFKIAAGAGAPVAMAVSETGEVWSWGGNHFGECNVEDTNTKTVALPTKQAHVSGILAVAVSAGWGMAIKFA